MSTKVKELLSEKLRYTCDPDQFDFETTENLKPLDEVVGQERAVRAIDFGVNIKNYGYNIFVLGPGGAGRTTIIKEAIERQAKKLLTPDDWCYVFNFKDPDQPNAIRFPAGKAKAFQREMNKLITELMKKIPDSLNSEAFQKERNQIFQRIQDKQNSVFSELNKRALAAGLILQKSPNGFLLAPARDGKILTPEQYNQLSEKEKNTLDENVKQLQAELSEAIQEVRRLEQLIKNDVEKLERETVKFAIGHLLDEIRNKFNDIDEVPAFLDQAEEYLLDNINEFKAVADSEDTKNPYVISEDDSFLDRFRINVIVDNGKTKGAPVIVESNPTYNNVIGRIDKKSHLGALITDFTMIKGGALHRANGGFLILEAEHIFRKPFVWEALKRTLKTAAVKITDLSEEYAYISTKTLEPESIPLDIKVILIGRPYIYYQLYDYDDEFRELFKVKAEFNWDMKLTKTNILKYAHFLSSMNHRENLLHFNKEAIARVVEYGAELVGDQKKLSTRFSQICNLAREANYWALKNKHNIITREDVQYALDEMKYRTSRYKEYAQERINNGSIYIHTKGMKIGEVNGLSVTGRGDFSFGLPTRISVRTYMGKSGVTVIDREVKLSGNIHDKGVLILIGFLHGKFGQKKQVSMSASITFEQNYGQIDGDSASSTELYGILSSLSGHAINQGIAVTGSVNQLGEIQPIGGVTEKIEGFFDICESGGLTGNQGVLIPKTNVKNLLLKQEVVDAVQNGKFHIYPITTIDEGIEILTGIPAGKLKKDGTYNENTVYGAVEKRLKEMDEQPKDSEKSNSEQKKSNNENK